MDSPNYIKVPVEMAQYALGAYNLRAIQFYLLGLFLYDGKVPIEENPICKVASFCEISKRTGSRSFKWLLNKNWINEKNNGWLFFHGIDTVHNIENWRYARAVILRKQDLRSSRIKAFMIGAVLASMVRTGGRSRTGPNSRGSVYSRSPISLKSLQKILNISFSTAYRYRKSAEKYGYIKMSQNLRQVKNITPDDVSFIKNKDIDSVNVELFGSTHSMKVSPRQFRIKFGKVWVQLPNLVEPRIVLKKR